MKRNQKAYARHADMAKGADVNAKPIENRERLGTERIFPDPFLDGSRSDLNKSRITKEMARHMLGYQPKEIHDVKSQHGPEHLGDMPQLGEGPLRGHRQQVVPLRHLK